MKPPTRLLADPTVAIELRVDLERSANAPPDYDVAAGLAAFQIAVACSAAVSIGTAAASGIVEASQPPLVAHVASGLGLGSKLSLLAGALTSVVVASVGLHSAITTPSTVLPKRSPPSAAHAAARPSAPVPAPEPAAEPALAPAPPPNERVELTANAAPPSNAALSKSAPNRAVAAPPDEQLRQEIEQLGHIKRLLQTDPAEAYRIASTGHREFRAGMLRQEREALALNALWNLGRRDEARAGVHSFLLRYPTSPMRERLLHLLSSGDE